uniref:Uncharacterized protein n=1 Tax=Populus trichocarpa TaxID=3694 RepID=A0A2K1XHB5_POPTR
MGSRGLATGEQHQHCQQRRKTRLNAERYHILEKKKAIDELIKEASS